MVALYYVKYKNLKELFLSMVCYFVWGLTIEKISNGSYKQLFPLLNSLGTSDCVTAPKCRIWYNLKTIECPEAT